MKNLDKNKVKLQAKIFGLAIFFLISLVGIGIFNADLVFAKENKLAKFFKKQVISKQTFLPEVKDSDIQKKQPSQQTQPIKTKINSALPAVNQLVNTAATTNSAKISLSPENLKEKISQNLTQPTRAGPKNQLTKRPQKGQISENIYKIPANSGTSRSGWEQVFDERFEWDFPADNWWVDDINSSNGSDYWDDTSYKSYNGSWSGYCADIGDTGINHKYDDNMDAYMERKWTVDASGWQSANLSYYAWYQTEGCCDYARAVVTGDAGSHWYFIGETLSGTSGWGYHSLDIPQEYLTSQFAFGFEFISDGSVTYEGVYLDDIILKKYTSPPPPSPTVSSNISSFNLSPNQTQDITFTMTNNGGESRPFYFDVSVSSGLDITSTWTDLGRWDRYNPGSLIWQKTDVNSPSLTSSYLLYSLVGENISFPANSTKYAGITIKANQSGSQWVKYRVSMNPAGTTPHNYNPDTYYRYPTSGGTDQQGWYAATINGSVAPPVGKLYLKVTDNDDDNYPYVYFDIDGDGYNKYISVNSGSTTSSIDLEVSPNQNHKVTIKWTDPDNNQTYYKELTKYVGEGSRIEYPFTIDPHRPPSKPLLLSPTNGSSNISRDQDLSWWPSSDPDGDSISYDVYFGTNSNPSYRDTVYFGSSYDPGTLNYNTTYYWKIIAFDSAGARSEPSDIWSFTTRAAPSPSVTADISSFNLQVNETKEITFTLSNNGGEARPFYFDVSVSSGLDITSTWTDLGRWDRYNPGSLIWQKTDVNSPSLTSSYLLYSLVGENISFPANSTKYAGITIKANQSGSQWIKYRLSMNPSDITPHNYNPDTYYRYPSSGVTDQQGWFALVINGTVQPQKGNLSVRVKNVSDGLIGIPNSRGIVQLYKSDGTAVGSPQNTINDNGDGIVNYTNLDPGNYYIKSYYNPPSGTSPWGQEYWGQSDLKYVTSGDNEPLIFTRNNPYITDIKFYNGSTELDFSSQVSPNTLLTAKIFIKNPQNSEVYVYPTVYVDRDQTSEYDFTLDRSGSVLAGQTEIFSRTFTPTIEATYFRSGKVIYNNQITDGWAWLQTFEVKQPKGNLQVTINNVIGGNPNVPDSNGKVELYNSTGNKVGEATIIHSGVGQGTADITAIPVGSNYSIRVYQSNSEWGNEYWGTKTAITINQGSNFAYFDREEPVGIDVSFEDATTGVAIDSSHPLVLGHSVQAKVKIKNPKNAAVPAVKAGSRLRLSGSANYIEGFSLAGDLGSGAESVYIVTLTPTSTGTYERTIAAYAYANGILTDGWAWTTVFEVQAAPPIVNFTIADVEGTNRTKRISGTAQAWGGLYITSIKIFIDGVERFSCPHFSCPDPNAGDGTITSIWPFSWDWTATSEEILAGNHTVTVKAYDNNNFEGQFSQTTDFTIVRNFGIADIGGNFGETAIGGYVYVTPGNSIPPNCDNTSPSITGCNNGLAIIKITNTGNVKTQYRVTNTNQNYNIRFLNPDTLNYADDTFEFAADRDQTKDIILSLPVPSSFNPNQIIDIPIEIAYENNSSLIHIVYLVVDDDFYSQYIYDHNIKTLQGIANFIIDVVFAQDSVEKEIEEYNKLSDTEVSALEKVFQVAITHPLESADIAISWTFIGGLAKDGVKIGIKSLSTSGKLGGEIVFKEFTVKNIDEMLVKNAQENVLSTAKKETLENIRRYGAEWLVKDTLKDGGTEVTQKFLARYGNLVATVGGEENVKVLEALAKSSHYSETGVRSVIREFGKISDLPTSKDLFIKLTQNAVGNISGAEKFYKQLRYTAYITERFGPDEAIKVMTIEHEAADVLVAQNGKLDFQEVKGYVVPSNIVVEEHEIGKAILKAKQYAQVQNMLDKSEITLVTEGFQTEAAKQAVIDYAKKQGFRYWNKGELTIVATGQDPLRLVLLGFAYFYSPTILTNNGQNFTTDSQSVTLEGTCDPATDSIWVNGAQDGVNYIPGGTHWSYATTLDKGTYNFSIVAKDVLGNESEAAVITVVVDPPPVILTNHGQNFSTDKPNLVLEGTAETFFSQVLVNGSSNGVIFDQASGAWSYNTILVTGENQFVVTAKTTDGIESDPTSITITLDTQAPLVAANPAGGTYTQPQNVTLFSNDPTAKIYYTLDGSEPTVSSTQYTSPINISQTTTLKFFGQDQAGNSSGIKTETYTFPTLTLNLTRGWNMVSVPSEFSDLTRFRANPVIWRYDNGAGQYVQVTDKLVPGEGYLVWVDEDKTIEVPLPDFDPLNYPAKNYQSGWILASPIWLEHTDQARIFYNNQLLTLSEAISQGVINARGFVFLTDHYELVDLTNPNLDLLKGKALWLYANASFGLGFGLNSGSDGEAIKNQSIQPLSPSAFPRFPASQL